MLYTISLLYHFMSWVSIGKNKDRLQIFFRTRRNIPANVMMEIAAFNLIESSKLYLPTQMRFLIKGKRVTCRGIKLTNSQEKHH